MREGDPRKYFNIKSISPGPGPGAGDIVFLFFVPLNEQLAHVPH